MKETRFTEEQMVTILREADTRPVPEVAKKHGVSDQTIYSWRKRVRCVYSIRSRRALVLVQESAETVATFQRDRLRPGPRR
jgi:transposase-like protein